MRIVVSTKNITHGCGKAFLRRNRIVALSSSDKIYRNSKALEKGEGDYCPQNTKEVFREATLAEKEKFYASVESLIV